MATAPQIELEIRSQLTHQKSARQVLADMLPRLFESGTNYQDRRAIFSFAVNCGIHLPLMEQLPEMLRLQQDVPWPWLVELCARTRAVPSSEVVEALVKGARTQEQIADLTCTRVWDKFIPNIQELRREVNTQREEQRRNQRQTLLDKVAFFRNERMTDEEQRLLDLMQKMYPDDEQIKKLQLEFGERWARHVINRHVTREEDIFEQNTLMTRPQDAALLDPAFREWRKIAIHRPDMIYEFAVALLMMNMDVMALEMLNQGNLDFAGDWLKAELLLRSHRHVECLDHLVHLEARYGSDPETAFAVTYTRAQALWGLKQHGRAIELLQTLANVRPTYRSAASMLKDWGAS
ncbi:MAG: hypothetical protein AB7N80_01865 [Bdellovibrionales bacterium]